MRRRGGPIRIGIAALGILLTLFAAKDAIAKRPHRMLGHTIAIGARLSADDLQGSKGQRAGKVTEAAYEIMDSFDADLEADKALGKIDDRSYRLRKEHYAKVRGELKERVRRMYFPRGVLNRIEQCVEQAIGWTTGQVERGIVSTIRRLPGDRECKEAISKVGAFFIVGNLKMVQNYRAVADSVKGTQRLVQADVDFFRDLGRKLKGEKTPPAAGECLQYLDRCLKNCDEIKADCIRVNCKGGGYSGCVADCGGCGGQVCGTAFNETWCTREPGYIGDASGLVSAYLGKVSNCTRTFAGSKENLFARAGAQRDCLVQAGKFFDEGFARVIDEACGRFCGDGYKVVPFNQCVCEETQRKE